MNDRDDRRDDNDRRPKRDEQHRRPSDGKRTPGSGQGQRPRNDGQRPRRDGERSYDRKPRHDGERNYGDRKSPRDGDRRPSRDDNRNYGDRKSPRDGDRSYGDRRPSRDGGRNYGDRKPPRDGERNHGDRKSSRDSDRSYGDRKPPRDGSRSYGDRPRRDGERPYDRKQAGDTRGNTQFGRGGTRGGGRSDRGGAEREFTEAERLQHELRPVRAEHDDPSIPDDVTEKDMHPGARNELKTLQPEVQERVARHLAMVAMLIDTDPELAHQHAISASRRAGRIPVARETLAVTAYHVGDYALALRELRTYRRLSGSQGHLALMVECERALGRPERGIETGLAADQSTLGTEQRVQLAIAMSGARLDLGQTQQALFELEIPELDPRRAFSWSPELFAAYAAVLEDLGRERESATWQQRALAAEEALNDRLAESDEIEVYEVHEQPIVEDPLPEQQPDTTASEQTEIE